MHFAPHKTYKGNPLAEPFSLDEIVDDPVGWGLSYIVLFHHHILNISKQFQCRKSTNLLNAQAINAIILCVFRK